MAVTHAYSTCILHSKERAPFCVLPALASDFSALACLPRQAYILQAAILIGAIMPMRRRLEKMNTRAAADDRTKYQKAYYGFRIFRAKFINMHSLPRNFMYDLYHMQSYKSYVTESLEVAPYCWMSIVVIFIIHVLVASYFKKVSDFLLSGEMFLAYGWLVRHQSPHPPHPQTCLADLCCIRWAAD